MASKKAREIARKKVFELLDLALIKAEEDIELATSYAIQAFNISRKFRIKIPVYKKRKFCRECKTPLIPGLTARVRVKRKTLVVTCLKCGWIRRYELRNKRENKEEKSGAR